MQEIYNFPFGERGATVLLYPTPYCPVGCKYCFETPFPFPRTYNKEAMKDTLDQLATHLQYKNLILHGGEVLKLPIKDFEYFINIMSKHEEHPSIQTSLWGLTDKHIKIMKKYQVGIGVSIDGPPELNILRGPRDPELNKNFQLEIVKNLKKLNSEGMSPGVISVLTKTNAGDELKLEKLVNWSIENTSGGRFNPMFVPNFDPNHPSREDVLSPEEFKRAWLYLLEASLKNSNFKPTFVSEMRDNLLGFHPASCTFARCDYLTTQCMTIMPDGGLLRCDRCLQDGYHYRSQGATQQRAFMLKQTECRGCRYWEVCAGGCPGEALNKNYRSKSSFCEAYYAVYERLESVLRTCYPNIILAIDIDNYFKNYIEKGRILHEELQIIRNKDIRDFEEKENNSCNIKNSCNPEKENISHIDHNDENRPYHLDGIEKGFINKRREGK